MKLNFKKGALDVFQKNKKIDPNELHSLIEYCERGSDFAPLFSQIAPSHLKILCSALNLTKFILSDDLSAISKTIPLWLKLFRRGRSLRNVSPQWMTEAKKFLALFQIEIDALTQDIQSDEYRLKLGLNPQKMENFSDFELAKLKLFQGSLRHSNSVLAKLSLNPSEHLSILAFQLARGSNEEMLEALETVEDVLCFLVTSRQIDPLRHIHILNSINLVNFKMARFEEAEGRIREVRSLVNNSLKNREEKNHALGISYFHEAFVEIEKGNKIRAIKYLEKSKNLDLGFFDCHYRLASLFHDLGDRRAKVEYETALSLSVFDYSLVNDFGVLLREMNLKLEFESLCKLATVIGLNGAGNE